MAYPAVDLRNTGAVLDDALPEPSDGFEHAAISLSLSDTHGRIIHANRRFWELFGHEPDASLDVGMLSRPSDRDWTLSYLTRLVTGDIDEYRTVKRFIRNDGTEFDGHMAISALTDDGRCTGMIASIEPVDVRPIVDSPRMRKLVEHGAGTITLVDLEGNVIETSGRYRETLGYPAEFWEERTILDLIVPEDLPMVMAIRDLVVDHPEQAITRDFRVHGADRRIETLEVTALNMLGDEDLQGIVLSTRNVTIERQNMSAVARLRDEAVDEADRRSHLLATVSHELRNPLHAMSGIVELLESDETLADGPRELAGSLLRQLRHLTSVTDDLLDTARLEEGRFEMRPSPVAIRDLLDDVVRVARSAAAGRIAVEQSTSADVPHLLTVDPARLQQVLGNLLGNSVKFTETGSVSLTTTMSADSEYVVFEVRDTGVGIPPDQTGEIFEPFSTARTSGDRRGAGLGLAIVHRLVEALDGSIDLRSEVGLGSVFTVRLPLIDAVQAAPLLEHQIVESDTRAQILVVEDTPVNQQLARHQLERLGMDCTIAGSAEDGLDELAARRFDVILMDHQLPGMNGRDATREIRRRGISTPIIGITASSTAADERACFDAGMDAFLPKPVGLDRLSTALRQVMSGIVVALPTEEPTGFEPAIDVGVLDDLVDDLDDRGIVEGLVRTFLAELDARESGIAGTDQVVASRQAHTLKSSAKLLGALELARVCAAAESDPGARSDIGTVAEAARVGLHAWLDATDEYPDGDEPGTPE